MKARTKSQRRGRPRKTGPREDNGRPQRPSVAEIRAGNVQARMLKHGLTLVQAGDRLAGYEIGRLYLRGQIDLVDVEVCDDYVSTVARYMSITNPQHPFPKAMDYLMAIKGQGGEPSADQIARTRRAYSEWVKPLEDCDSRSRMTFHGVVFYDVPVAFPGSSAATESRLEQVKECVQALRRKFR